MSIKINKLQKLIVTHIFLNLYLLAIIQPVLPVLQYVLNYDYIASELCENRDKPIQTCNGKCYLEKQVAKQQNLVPNQTVPMPPKVDLEKYFTLKTDNLPHKISDVLLVRKSPIFFKLFKESTFIKSLFRPPSF